MNMVPIAIFAFNRLDLLKETLKALELCDGFPGGPLHVFSDGARTGRPGEAAEVDLLRIWLQDWCGRNQAILHLAPDNMGLRASITSGVSALLEEYDRVIVLEDDIVVSRSFLKFIHDALDAFKDRDDVYQVSGYFVPHRNKLHPAGLLRMPACWGWATWRRAWRHYSDDAEALISQIARKDVHAFDIDGTYPSFEALEQNASGELSTWFIRWYASIFLRQGLTIYPGTSLTRNIGFGEGGTNCGIARWSKVYTSQKIDQRDVNVDWKRLGRFEDARYLETLKEFYQWQRNEWVKPTTTQVWRARWLRLTGRDWKSKTP